jgi:hypothetical protein
MSAVRDTRYFRAASNMKKEQKVKVFFSSLGD